MDSENRRICVCRNAADLIRPMKTEKWCGDNLFRGVSAPFFLTLQETSLKCAMQVYKITLFSVQPSTPESESLFRLS